MAFSIFSEDISTIKKSSNAEHIVQNLQGFDFALEADEKVGEVIGALSSGAKESGGSGLAFVTELFDCGNWEPAPTGTPSCKTGWTRPASS